MDYSYTSKERSKGEECVLRTEVGTAHALSRGLPGLSGLRAASDLYPTGPPFDGLNALIKISEFHLCASCNEF